MTLFLRVYPSRQQYRLPKEEEAGVFFFFFSNRLGCLGSIVVSLVGTLILLALLHVI